MCWKVSVSREHVERVYCEGCRQVWLCRSFLQIYILMIFYGICTDFDLLILSCSVSERNLYQRQKAATISRWDEIFESLRIAISRHEIFVWSRCCLCAEAIAMQCSIFREGNEVVSSEGSTYRPRIERDTKAMMSSSSQIVPWHLLYALWIFWMHNIAFFQDYICRHK